MIKKYLYLVLLIIYGCGFNPIYINQNENNFEFSEIILKGDSALNDRLVKSIDLKEDELNPILNKIIIDSVYSISQTSKDSTGKVTSYRSNLEFNIEIQSSNNKIKSKKFVKNFSYTTKDNQFELVKYQEQIKNNLFNEITSEIILFLNIDDS